MRQIKFRQALYKNGKFNGFAYWGFLDKGFSGITTDNNGNYLSNAEENSEQFTGLLDDSQKEAYDGDVAVDCRANHWKIMWQKEEARFILAPIGKNKNTFQYKYMDMISTMKIIGNIRDNPELLK